MANFGAQTEKYRLKWPWMTFEIPKISLFFIKSSKISQKVGMTLKKRFEPKKKLIHNLSLMSNLFVKCVPWVPFLCSGSVSVISLFGLWLTLWLVLVLGWMRNVFDRRVSLVEEWRHHYYTWLIYITTANILHIQVTNTLTESTTPQPTHEINPNTKWIIRSCISKSWLMHDND